MSLTVGELQVLLSGDPSKLNRDLDKIDARAADTERTHSAAWGRIGAVMGTAVKAGAVVGTGAVLALGAAINKGIDLVGFQQQAQISFATLLGGADKAKAYLADLTAFAARTPFEMPGVVQAAQQLLGVGRSAESVIPTLEAWGNASGALGQTQEQFGRTMLAVTQMIGKGKVSAEEMMQITEAGIPIWGLMAQATGKPIAELQKLASEGKLLADDVLPALESQMQKNYGGAMAAQAQTLNGVLSTAKDNLNLALADGVKPLAAGLTVLLPPATAKAGEAIRELGQRGSQGLVDLIDTGQKLATQFGPELSQVADMARTKWGQFTDTVKRIGAEIGPSLPSVAESLVRIAQVGIDVGTGMLPVLNAGIDALGPIAQSAAGMLQMIAGALEAIEPVLPLVVAGFVAFKGLSAVNGLLGGFRDGVSGLAGRMSEAAINAGVFTEKVTGSAGAGQKVMTTMGKASTAVSAIGSALPIASVAVAMFGAAMADASSQTASWAQGLLDGGKAAQQAIAGAAAERAKYGDNWVGDLSYNIDQFFGLASSMDDAKKQADELKSAMSPLQLAQQDVTTATNDLALMQQQYGRDSGQAFGASVTLRDAQANLEQKQRDLENATRSASQSLLDQANQAIGLANADIGLSNATLGVQNSQANYATVMADAASTTADRQQAENDLASAMINGAGAAGRKAEADNAGKTPAEIHAASTKAQYDALVAFAQQAGGNVPATVQTLMGSLSAATSTGAVMTAQMRDLGVSVTEIPGEKFVRIDAPTSTQQADIERLGGVVRTLPDGHVYVFANTADADAAVTNFVSKRRTIDILVRAQMPDLNGAVSGSGRMGTAAVGGRVGARARGFSAGGRLDGPGGPTDDRIPALTYSGLPLMLSDDEWVIKARSAALYGDRAMAAVNAGTARIYAPTGSASGATTSTGSGSVNRSYSWQGVVREEMSLDRFIALQRQAEAIYG